MFANQSRRPAKRSKPKPQRKTRRSQFPYHSPEPKTRK